MIPDRGPREGQDQAEREPAVRAAQDVRSGFRWRARAWLLVLLANMGLFLLSMMYLGSLVGLMPAMAIALGLFLTMMFLARSFLWRCPACSRRLLSDDEWSAFFRESLVHNCGARLK